MLTMNKTYHPTTQLQQEFNPLIRQKLIHKIIEKLT